MDELRQRDVELIAAGNRIMTHQARKPVARKSHRAKVKLRRQLTIDGLRVLDTIWGIVKPLAPKLFGSNTADTADSFSRRLSAKMQLADEFDDGGGGALWNQIARLPKIAARLRHLARGSVTSAEERILEAASEVRALLNEGRGGPSLRTGVDCVVALTPLVMEIGRARVRGWIGELLAPTSALAIKRRTALPAPDLPQPKRPSTARLTQSQLEILQAMSWLQAFSEDRRKSAREIAVRAAGARTVSSAFKQRLRVLYQRKYIDVIQAGRSGGYWLTKLGKRKADEAESKYGRPR